MKKNPDLLLVHPSIIKEVYEKVGKFAAIEPPFIAALMASYVRDKGFEVELLDANVRRLNQVETAEMISEINPKLVGIISQGHQPSASSQLMGAVGNLCREIKKIGDFPILLTGNHPTALPERTLREESCDFVARGEPQKTFISLLENLESKNFSKVPGLCYMDDGTFTMNPAAPLENNLDETFPNVAWDLLPMKDYRSHDWHANFGTNEDRQPYGAIYTSLGCPFKCTFCCINTEFKASLEDNKSLEAEKGTSESNLLNRLVDTNPKIRYWSAEWVIKQIGILVEEYGVRNIKFIDEMYFFNPKHVEGIADKILEKGYDINIWAYGRVDSVKDEKLIAKAHKAGLNWLCLGIESANSDVRHGAEKKFGNEDIFNTVRRIENAGIHVLANYMFGLRHDTIESMRQTLDMAKELNAAYFNLYATMSYPGTADYIWAREKDFDLPGDPKVPGGWTAYSHHSWYTLPLPTDHLSSSQVLKARDEAFHEFFTNPKYLSSVQDKFGSAAVDHIKRMSEHKIKRRIFGDPMPEHLKQNV